MTQLTIQVTPELERWLQEEAARRGRGVEEVARVVLEETARRQQPFRELAPAKQQGTKPDYWPRRSPEYLDELARQQGVGPARFENLLGNFWPEDESVDDFLEARRQWQREGSVGFPWDEDRNSEPLTEKGQEKS